MERTQWVNRKELDQLNHEFGFPSTGKEQDWEIEFADPKRVEEFIKAYEESGLNDPQKIMVMDLVIASYDELLITNPNEINLWNRIANHLKDNFSIHQGSIDYWSCPNADSSDHMFNVTNKIRALNI